MKKSLFLLIALTVVLCLRPNQLQAQRLNQSGYANQLAKEIEPKVIEWRRYFHENPELSNREFETAKVIAKHLQDLGMEVQTGVAHTGVVGILKGGKPGPVVALRADIDALPVTERTPVPFASKVTSTYNDQDVGVMHACGHDTHIAILMGTAEVLSKLKKNLQGTVKFIFQPAEEGAPKGEEGGAKLMVKEGVLKNPDVDVIFGLHISSDTEVGHIEYRPGGTMASADRLEITVKGKQTHGSKPWAGADPITASAYIITGLQTVISRETELTTAAGVVTIGSIHGGVRENIIPEEVKLLGTIRALDPDLQDIIHEKIKLVATKTAEAHGTIAEVEITKFYPITYNDEKLTEQVLPVLKREAGAENVHLWPATTGAEDFSYFQQKIPGFYFFLGGMPPGEDPKKVAAHHTPDFFIDESGLGLGVRVMTQLALDYMKNNSK